jgi:hypothetical protein
MRPIRRVDFGEVERGDRRAVAELFQLFFPIGDDALGLAALAAGERWLIRVDRARIFP